jgi:adenosylcobinamide kinase/adenosylcobinamide-phosphate guanylyltransferase
MHEKTHLVTGGCRSGKSRFALKLAELARKPYYIATAVVGDDEEMIDRIRKHQAERGSQWQTIEEPLALHDAIRHSEGEGADHIVIDCLTIWTSNVMFAPELSVETELANLVNALKNSNVQITLVTNEVGAGVVPGDPVSREFRDSAGIVNQAIAKLAPNVTMTVCGIPITVKSTIGDCPCM